MNNNPSIVVIGGIEVGKSTTIQEMWQCREIISTENGIMSYSVEDDVPGRGVMAFEVHELPDIIYSKNEEWMNDFNIRKSISESDVILFIIPAFTFGYKLELSTFIDIIESDMYKKQHIVIAINKSDMKLFEKDDSGYPTKVNLDGISDLISISQSIYGTIKDKVSECLFDETSVIPISSLISWNTHKLKEKLWEGVIEKNNQNLFDKNLPTVVIAGKRGCGKSTTLNELYGLNLPTNKAVACTKYPMVIHATFQSNGKTKSINIVDLPGIAESLDADMKYSNFYRTYINKASVLICLSQADTRAYKQDELFYNNLIQNGIITQSTSIILGINQIDLLFKSIDCPDGIDLNTITSHHPMIEEKIVDYYENVYKDIFKDFPDVSKDNVCVYSAIQRWNLEELKNKIESYIFNN